MILRAALGVVCLFLLGLTLIRSPLEPDLRWGFLLAACLALELAAPALPGVGVLSGAPALALGLAPRIGVGAAALLYLAATLVRPRGLGTWVAGALPVLLGLTAVGATGHVWLGAAIWLVVAALLPGLLAPEHPQENASGRLGIAAAAPIVALLPGWSWAWAIPLLAALELASKPGRVPRHELERARQEQQKLQSALDELTYQLEHARGLAVSKAEELRRLEHLTRALTRSEALATTLEGILNMAAGAAPRAQSLAVFLEQEGRLVPAGHRTPHRARLLDAPLLKLQEPIVERAHAQGAAVYADKPVDGPRIFEGELPALAVPLEREGVLYVGGPMSEEERDIVAVVGAQAAVALQSARRRESEQRALVLHREAHARLQQWLDRLARLLEGTREVISTLDLPTLTERMQQMLRAVVPHDAGAILTGEPLRPLRMWPPNAFEPGPTLQLAGTVLRNRRPLMLEEPRLLMVPWLDEKECLGVVLLGRAADPGFTREDQDVMQLVAFMLAVGYQNARLHQEVKEAQAQVLHSSKLAAVGQLAAGVAHELNTPLGAILMSAEGAAAKLPDRPDLAAKRLEKIRSATTQAQKIVANLLLYTRGGEAFDPVSLPSVLENTLALVGFQLRNEEVQLEIVAGEVPPVLGNASQLQQIVTNLLTNARDSGGKHVRVELYAADGRACLAVEDDGPGVPPEVAERIFEPFFTTKAVGRGTGLGLAISHQIAERHGGTLKLVQEPGRGARFVLSLPAR